MPKSKPITMEQRMAAWMLMNDETWQRHANPLSGYSRMLTLPMLVLLLWKRRSLGGWTWVGLLFLMIWNWWNPRAFPRPKQTNNWMSKAVLGERIWLQRGQLQVPPPLTKGIERWILLSASGMPFLIHGLWRFRPGSTGIGMVLIYLGKLLFLNRMVKLTDARRSQKRCH